jgi:DNA modification methylase
MTINPAMARRIEVWPLERLVPYDRNPRRHSDEQVDRIAASISAHGFNNPVLVDRKDGIIAGHGRYQAAQRLGLTEVPVIVLDHLTETQKRAYLIADNRLAELAVWDDELLLQELTELEAGGALELAGYHLDELEVLAKGVEAQLTAEISDPGPGTPPKHPVTRPGDLWALGEHRLLCGDSTKSADVRRAMGGREAAVLATDPPYLVDYTSEERLEARNGRSPAEQDWDRFEGDDAGIEFYVGYLAACLKHCRKDVPVYQWHAHARADLVAAAWKKVGLLAHQQIIWAKSRAVLSRSHFMWGHEPCLYGWPKGKMPKKARRPPASESTVWPIENVHRNEMHPTQKPLELFLRPLLFHTRPGETSLEPFSGSGTQIVAAESLGRRCCAIEISPAFCDVAIERWQEAAGKSARLAGGKRRSTFAAARKARRK